MDKVMSTAAVVLRTSSIRQQWNGEACLNTGEHKSIIFCVCDDDDDDVWLTDMRVWDRERKRAREI